MENYATFNNQPVTGLSVFRMVLAVTVLAVLQGCGGGGSGGGTSTPPPGTGSTPLPPASSAPLVSSASSLNSLSTGSSSLTSSSSVSSSLTSSSISSDAASSIASSIAGVATYGDRTLPGRLLVNAPDGRNARLMNLTTGVQSALPASANPTFDKWTVNQNGKTLVRLTRDDGLDEYPVAWVDATTLAVKGTPTSVSDLLEFSDLLLSADGDWALAQYGDNYRADRRLTVFNAQDMSVHKRGSQLDDASVTGEPQAWLPDGRYLYLRANDLWVSSPSSNTSELVATLALPPNDVVYENSYVAGKSTLAISPDGSRIAFTWRVKRANDMDTLIFTARTDGSDLRQMTAVADATDSLSYDFGSPTWSPDGQWIAFVLYMSGATTAPVWPEAEFGGARVIGTTGCDTSTVYVLPAAQAQPQPFDWPAITPHLALKVYAETGGNGEWVSSCSRVHWLP